MDVLGKMQASGDALAGGSDKKDESAEREYLELCSVFNGICKTTKRLEIQRILTEYFFSFADSGQQKGLLHAIYLCINKVGSLRENLALGVGESLLTKAVSEFIGENVEYVKEQLKRSGDLGSILAGCGTRQRSLLAPQKLTLELVYNKFRTISTIQSEMSHKRKLEHILSLLVSSRESESLYIIRSLQGELRIGLAEKTVLICISRAFVLKERGACPSAEEAVPEDDFKAGLENLKTVYSQVPTYDEIIPHLFRYGIFDINRHCIIRPGVSVNPMLGYAINDIGNIVDRFKNECFVCECKYDGERIQIHKSTSGNMSTFSRSLEDTTKRFPDVVSIMSVVGHNAESFIIDCEVVAWDPQKKRIMPFQVLSARKKRNVMLEEIDGMACIYAFDILYLNGASLIEKPYQERRRFLREMFSEAEGKFQYVKDAIANNIEDVQGFF